MGMLIQGTNMKITLTNFSRTGHVTHGNETIDFNMSKYRSINKNVEADEAVDPFYELNLFLGHLDEERQKQIFEIFKNCKTIFTNEFEIDPISEKLADEFEKLYNIFSIEEVDDWVQRYAIGRFIHYPPGMLKSFDDMIDKSLATPEQTYVEADYRGLINLIIAFRLVTPVLGEFIDLTYNHAGSSYKELYAYRLLYKTSLVNTKEMKRLMTYIEFTIPNSFDYTSVILDGISRDDFPEWTLSRVMISCIGLIDISGYPADKVSIIIVICNYITQRTPKSDRNFYGRVDQRQKTKGGAGSGDMETLAPQEAYHTRTEVSVINEEMASVFMRDLYKVCHALDETIPKELVDEVLPLRSNLFNVEIGKGQIVLAKWVINTVVPGRMVDYMIRDTLINVLLATQVYLWHKGFYNLAALSTAVALDHVVLADNSRRSRLTKDMNDPLIKIFPYYRHVPGKQKEQPSILQCITNVTEYLSTASWRLNMPTSWLEQGKISNHGIMFNTPETIRVDLMQLATLLGQREIPFIKQEVQADINHQ